MEGSRGILHLLDPLVQAVVANEVPHANLVHVLRASLTQKDLRPLRSRCEKDLSRPCPQKETHAKLL